MTEENYSRIEKYRQKRAHAQETTEVHPYSKLHTYTFYRNRRHEPQWRPAYLEARRRHWLQILASTLGAVVVLGIGLLVLGHSQQPKPIQKTSSQSSSQLLSSRRSSAKQASQSSQAEVEHSSATPAFSSLPMKQQRDILKEWAMDYAQQIGHFGFDQTGNLIPYTTVPRSQIGLKEIPNGFELTAPEFGKLNPQQLESGKTMADIYADLPDWSYRIIDQHNGHWELWVSTSGVQPEPNMIVTDPELVARYVN